MVTVVTKPRSFLEFPGELRNLVYDHCLRRPTIDLIAKPKLKDPDADIFASTRGIRVSTLESHLRPALIATCKQIHAEGAPILYCANFWPGDINLEPSLQLLEQFLLEIGTHAPLVKHISIFWHGGVSMHRLDKGIPALVVAKRLEKLSFIGNFITPTTLLDNREINSGY